VICSHSLAKLVNTIFVRVLLLVLARVFSMASLQGWKDPRFRVVALPSTVDFTAILWTAAKVWLGGNWPAKQFTVDYIEDTQKIDDAFLRTI